MEGQGRQPINGHALQDYHTQLMILGQVRRERERELSRQTAAASPTRESEITETSESSSPGTLAEHSDDAHVRSLKRRRSNDTETRSNQSGTFFAYIPSGESSNYNGLSAVQISNTELPPHFDLIYQIRCDHGDSSSHPAPAFRDLPIPNVPWLAQGQGDSPERSHLNGTAPILNLDTYFNDESSDTTFVVVRTVECSNASILMARANVPIRPTERIYVKSRTSKNALHKIAMCHFQSDSKHEHDRIPHKEAPFSGASYAQNEIAPLKLFLFHHHSTMKQYIREHPIVKDHISGLLQYSEARYGNDFKEAEALFERGLVNQKHILKLYRPNDIVVGEIRGRSAAFIVHDWPREGQRNCTTLNCWSFQTDGFGFARKLSVISIPPIGEGLKEVPSLSAYPIRFASPEVKETIRVSGWRQWSFRTATQVMYTGWNFERDQSYHEARFMIDHRSNRKMNGEATAFTFDKPAAIYPYDKLPAYLNPEQQPLETLLSLLSPTIYGFNLSKKQWIHLFIDSIQPVSWNKKAYDRLVLPTQTKDLIRHLVSVQKSYRSVNQANGLAGTRADIMGGKGNGLTMLLHGSSGTGKTLTTESIAEIAETPLYRVTCGGIGTSGNAIENDLASILDLAQTWNCVLLLEEADIFLEKGSLSDPTRSSFVSTLLRAIEHYNGILILTSTGVGVFDEAITSRIRVMLHYEHLNQSSRKQIWQNFIDLFKEDKGRANFEEIRVHLDDLAGKELNGHQIRNVFKTAKELAGFGHERLEWDHFVQALSMSSTSTNI